VVLAVTLLAVALVFEGLKEAQNPGAVQSLVGLLVEVEDKKHAEPQAQNGDDQAGDFNGQAMPEGWEPRHNRFSEPPTPSPGVDRDCNLKNGWSVT
jgi:hypothetical protein